MTEKESISTKESKATWDLLVEVKRIMDNGLMKVVDDIDDLKNDRTKDYYKDRERDRKIQGVQKELKQIRRDIDKRFKAILLQLPQIQFEPVSKWTIIRDFVNKKEFIYIFAGMMVFVGLTVIILELANLKIVGNGVVNNAIDHLGK